MSELNSIVNVTIELNKVAVNTESFDTILIIGSRPSAWEDWTAATAYTVGDLVTTGTNLYECTEAGTSGSVKPTHTTGTATDGTVTWQYKMNVEADVLTFSTIDEVISYGWVTSGTSQDAVGRAARIAFSQSPRPAKIMVAPRKYQLVSSVMTEEAALATLQRAISVDGWYVVTTAGVPELQFQAIAQYIETQNKMFVYTTTSDATNDPVDEIYYRTAGYFCKETYTQNAGEVPADNLYLGLAAAVRYLNYQAGKETWVYKSLSSIIPSTLTTTQIESLEGNNLNYYETVANVNVTRGGKVKAGEWIDVIRFRDWLQNEMQYRIVNLLFTNPKIPFTNAGINLVHNQMISALNAGVDAGGISPDEFDAEGNIIKGYTTHVPDSTEITQSDRAARKLTGCTFEANLAGAIHAVTIKGALVYPTN